MLTILQGDCVEQLRTLPDASVQCCVTSPPYWGLRDYGVPGQLGLEKTPDEYVAKMVAVFREVRRVLKDDGTLWLNLGDSYFGSWGNYSGENRGKGYQREIVNGSSVPNPAYNGREKCRPATAFKHETLKPKDLVGIPWMVAFALRADGWYLRQDIIWAKPNPMPESVRDRCTKAHEYIFLLSKSPRYFYDAEAVQEASSYNTNERRKVFPAGWGQGDEPRTAIGLQQPGVHRKSFKGSVPGRADGPGQERRSKNNRKLAPSGTGVKNNASFDEAMAVMPEMRNKRSVWTVGSAPFPDAHFATYPPALINPCILAGSRAGDVVLDPFGGSGTTGMVALELGRRAVLIELNPDYVKLIEQRCDVTPGLPLVAA